MRSSYTASIFLGLDSQFCVMSKASLSRCPQGVREQASNTRQNVRSLELLCCEIFSQVTVAHDALNLL